MKRFFTSVALALLTFSATLAIGQTAQAQDQEPDFAKIMVHIVQPDGWEDFLHKTPNPPKERIALFIDPQTEHRIEVMARFQTNETHTNALVTSFHEHLRNTLDVKSDSEKIYELDDGQPRTGRYVIYSTRESEVPITVVTFAFPAAEAAYLVVGYFANVTRDEGLKTFDDFIRRMTNIR